MAKTYAQKLLDPRWQKKRLEVLHSANWRCQACERSDDTLHVHHKFYRKCEPWEYSKHELVSLCAQCHSRIEKYRAAIAEIINELMPLDLSWVLESLRKQFHPSDHPPDDGDGCPTPAETDEFFASLKGMLDGIEEPKK